MVGGDAWAGFLCGIRLGVIPASCSSNALRKEEMRGVAPCDVVSGFVCGNSVPLFGVAFALLCVCASSIG